MSPPTHLFTRFLMLRVLGLVSLFAFQGWLDQGLALVGSQGLLPADLFLSRVEAVQGSTLGAFFALPTLFLWGYSDQLLIGAAALGWILSLLCLLGRANALSLGLLWALHLSLGHIGQRFWGYGWENQLAETFFLAIFLVPAIDTRPFRASAPPRVVILLFRWLIFRVMLGAGLIKLRGDPCWTDLSCLFFHFETQPIPGPLSAFFHFLPAWMLKGGVLFNHLVELVVPFGVFGPRRVRHASGLLLLLFQLTLIASGNLSFLNWLTLVPILACFDDAFWRALLPRRLLPRLSFEVPTLQSHARRGWAAAALVLVLSPPALANLLSSEQQMNVSHDPFAIVNSHGNFGSVGRLRPEIVIEGTQSADPAQARWEAYEFPCKPGAPERRPCLTSPYQPRLAWQLWFAAMGQIDAEPWLVHLVYKLLHNDGALLKLVEHNPFPETPPRFVRIRRYRYNLMEGETPWRRVLMDEYLGPLAADDPRLLSYLRGHGLLGDERRVGELSGGE